MMQVRKGGITRQIDDKRLQEYKDKGYEPVEQPAEEPKKAKPSKESKKLDGEEPPKE